MTGLQTCGTLTIQCEASELREEIVMVYEPKAVAGMISSLARLITEWQVSRREGKQKTPRSLDRILGKRQKLDEGTTTLLWVAGPSTLDVVGANVERARNLLLKALKDPSLDSSGKDREIAVAQSTVCAELGRLGMGNASKLPDALQRVWEACSCSAVEERFSHLRTGSSVS